MRLNKKSEAYNIMWNTIMRLPYIALLFIIFLYLNGQLMGKALDSHKVNNQIMAKRIIYSPSALAYQDETLKRVYPGIVDLTKAEQANFDEAFIVFEASRVAAKIELQTLGGTELRELYINRLWYDRWNPYSVFAQFDKEVFKRYVLIKDGEDYSAGIIKIHIVGPK